MTKAILAKSGTFWIPNTKQKELARLLADPSDLRANKEKAESVGLPLRSFYRYLGNPNFIEYVNSFVPQETDKEIAPIWRSLCNEAKKGNIQAIMLFFKAKGIYMPKNQMELKSFSIYNQFNQLSNEELLQKKREFEYRIMELIRKEDERNTLEDMT